ncbi:MAG: uracil-DNA glycosylase [Pseudomonadales bacterium]
MSEQRIGLEASWLSALADEFNQPYMQNLRQFLLDEKAAGKSIHPPGSLYFAALNATPLDKVKAVILGQDPYHGPGQAHGLCFSVRPGVPLPPSLVNIYKEVQSDLNLGRENFHHGCLQHWADQGVLLLNSVLTVEQHRAASHQGKGWETFTDRIVQILAVRENPIVFLLWGSYAQKKGAVIPPTKHKILKAPHPSPLSAHRGFFGCRHFSQCNDFLQERGATPIDWGIPKEV